MRLSVENDCLNTLNLKKDYRIYVKGNSLTRPTFQVFEGKALASKKARDKLFQKMNFAKKSSSVFKELSSPNLMVVEKLKCDPYAIGTPEEANHFSTIRK